MSVFLTLLLYINHPQKAHSSKTSMVSQKSPTLGFLFLWAAGWALFSPPMFFAEGGVKGEVVCLLVLVFGFVPSYCDLIFKRKMSSSVGSVLDTLLDFKHHFFPPLNWRFKTHRDVFDLLAPYFSAEDGSAPSEVMASGRVLSAPALVPPVP